VRLLFDQNLSHRLIDMLADLYPESIHVRDVELQTADDQAVWDYATHHRLVIVSKDSDFHQRSFLLSPSPKAIWIQRGNCSTNEIATILRTHHAEILSFAAEETNTFLALA